MLKKFQEVQIMQYAKSSVKTIDIRMEWTVSRKVVESTFSENVKISPRLGVGLKWVQIENYFHSSKTPTF